MKKIFLHPYAGVLSAYGMGLADIRATRVSGVEQPLTSALIPQLMQLMEFLETPARSELSNHKSSSAEKVVRKLNLKYEGTNSVLTVDFASDIIVMQQFFEAEHKSRYGFIQSEKSLIVESISVELIQKMDTPSEPVITRTRALHEVPNFVEIVRMFAANRWYDTPIYRREDLQPQDSIIGPAIIVEKISTIVIEPNWQARLTERNHLLLQRVD